MLRVWGLQGLGFRAYKVYMGLGPAEIARVVRCSVTSDLGSRPLMLRLSELRAAISGLLL